MEENRGWASLRMRRTLKPRAPFSRGMRTGISSSSNRRRVAAANTCTRLPDRASLARRSQVICEAA
jgi:hypothetical protein